MDYDLAAKKIDNAIAKAKAELVDPPTVEAYQCTQLIGIANDADDRIAQIEELDAPHGLSIIQWAKEAVADWRTLIDAHTEGEDAEWGMIAFSDFYVHHHPSKIMRHLDRTYADAKESNKVETPAPTVTTATEPDGSIRKTVDDGHGETVIIKPPEETEQAEPERTPEQLQQEYDNALESLRDTYGDALSQTYDAYYTRAQELANTLPDAFKRLAEAHKAAYSQ